MMTGVSATASAAAGRRGCGVVRLLARLDGVAKAAAWAWPVAKGIWRLLGHDDEPRVRGLGTRLLLCGKGNGRGDGKKEEGDALRTAEAVLFWMAHCADPEPRWGGDMQELVVVGTLPSDLARTLVPLGPRPVRVPRSVDGAVPAAAVHGYFDGDRHQGTEEHRQTSALERAGVSSTKHLRLVLHARSVAEASAFVARALAGYDAACSAERERRLAQPAHYKFDVAGGYVRAEIPPKTFANLFVPAADVIKAALDAVSRPADPTLGMSQNLMLLLHGVPGGGKTSVAAALARHSNRSLVTVPASAVASAREFVDLLGFSDRTVVPLRYAVVAVDDADMCRMFRDCGRGDGPAAAVSKPAQPRSRRAQSPDTPLSDEDSDALGSSDSGSAGRSKGRKKNPASRGAVAVDGVDKARENLSTLLNLFDGPDVMPGSVIVFTANIVDGFDPALTRPGRAKKVCMGRLSPENVSSYFQLYFKRDPSQRTLEHIGVAPPTLGELSELLREHHPFAPEAVEAGLLAITVEPAAESGAK